MVDKQYHISLRTYHISFIWSSYDVIDYIPCVPRGLASALSASQYCPVGSLAPDCGQCPAFPGSAQILSQTLFLPCFPTGTASYLC